MRLVDTAGLLPLATGTCDGVIYWTKRVMDLHRRTWPGWEGESEIRQMFGPES